jgi:phage terminase Nu1 subunit (DNA packaging protein)
MMATAKIRTDAALAEALGVSDRSVRSWKKKGMPPKRRGVYDLAAIQAWRADANDRALRARKETTDEKNAGDAGANVLAIKRVADARLATRKAELADLDLQSRKGEIFPRAEHHRIVTELIYVLRRRLETIARAAATAKEKKRLRTEHDRLLDDLSAQGSK